MVAVDFPEAGCVGIHEACAVFCQLLVYGKCMTRTNIDIDDRACTEIMRRYQFETKREAVNFALQTLASEAMTLEEARWLRGSGWEGDLDSMRSDGSS